MHKIKKIKHYYRNMLKEGLLRCESVRTRKFKEIHMIASVYVKNVKKRCDLNVQVD